MSAWATVCFDTSHTPFRDFDPIDMMWYSVKRVDESGYNESCLPIAPAGGSSSRYFKWAQHLCMCKLKSMYWTTVLVMLTEVITYSSRARADRSNNLFFPCSHAHSHLYLIPHLTFSDLIFLHRPSYSGLTAERSWNHPLFIDYTPRFK